MPCIIDSEVPNSRRGRILKNLLRQLSTIAKADGYNTDLAKATTQIKNWDQTTSAECPVIFVIDMDSTPTYHSSKLTEWDWQINLTGLMKDRSQLEMEDLVADVQDCLFKNITLSFDGEIPGPCSQIRIGRVATDGQLMHEIDGSQLFTIQIHVKYTADAFRAR
jgi:hypothetical protein